MKYAAIWAVVLTLLRLFNSTGDTARAQGTAFTYQGRLNTNGAAANGSYDLSFALYSTNVNGTLLAGPVTNLAVGVTNGLFTTAVNFGNVFTSTNYWLQMAVRYNGATAFTPLLPREPLTPVPQALYATTAGSLAAAPSGYLFAYNTASLIVVNPGGSLPFATEGVNNGWTDFTTSFQAQSGGLYLVQLAGSIQAYNRTDYPIVVEVNGLAYPGGEIDANFDAEFSLSLIVSLNAGDLLSVVNQGSSVLDLQTPSGSGPAISLTVSKLK